MIFGNIKGTTSPDFKIGKGGITIFQGSTDPALSVSVSESDIWIDTGSNVVNIRDGSQWEPIGGTIVDYGTIA